MEFEIPIRIIIWEFQSHLFRLVKACYFLLKTLAKEGAKIALCQKIDICLSKSNFLGGFWHLVMSNPSHLAPKNIGNHQFWSNRCMTPSVAALFIVPKNAFLQFELGFLSKVWVFYGFYINF